MKLLPLLLFLPLLSYGQDIRILPADATPKWGQIHIKSVWIDSTPSSLVFFPAAAQDSTITLPLWMGRRIESDLRRLDWTDSLLKLKVIDSAMLQRQVANRDSLIANQTIQLRTNGELCDLQILDVKGELKAEKKRRRWAAIWRDIFIATTASALYLAIEK